MSSLILLPRTIDFEILDPRTSSGKKPFKQLRYFPRHSVEKEEEEDVFIARFTLLPRIFTIVTISRDAEIS